QRGPRGGALTHRAPPDLCAIANRRLLSRVTYSFVKLFGIGNPGGQPLMLHEFLTTNRDQLIERCRLKAALKIYAPGERLELAYGVPLFLNQIIKTLQVEQTAEPMRSRKVSGASGGGRQSLSEMGATARQP